MTDPQVGPAGSAMPRLQAVDIDKGFPGVQALKRVDLEVMAGDVHGLVGENGAGKSTRMTSAPSGPRTHPHRPCPMDLD